MQEQPQSVQPGTAGVQDRGQADVADDAGLEALEQLLRAQLQLASRLRISECMSNQVGSLRGALSSRVWPGLRLPGGREALGHRGLEPAQPRCLDIGTHPGRDLEQDRAPR